MTFDDPHLRAGTALEGAYPSGVMDWPPGEWKIGVPGGKLGTFNLIPANQDPGPREIAFPSPRVFVGIDVYNGGPAEAVISIRSGSEPDVASTLQPGELRRIRTAWKEPSPRVVIDLQRGEGMRFDNLAYSYP